MRVLRLFTIGLLALLLGGAGGQTEPRVLSVHFERTPEAGSTAVLRVRVKDPLAAVNGVQVDFGDGRGAFASSACRPGGRPGSTDGPFKPATTVDFLVPHVYALPGDYELRITATSGDCVTGPVHTKRKLVAKVRLPLPGATEGATTGKVKPPTATAAQAAGCPGAETVPTAANRLQAKTALRCLVNAYRASKGARALKANTKLTAAAKRHSDDMVTRRYFAHESPLGVDLADRLRRSKYRGVAAGENIGAGTDVLSTPMAIFLGWLDSPPHKENMLEPGFDETGIGVALGFPTGSAGSPGATYTMTFGNRR